MESIGMWIAFGGFATGMAGMIGTAAWTISGKLTRVETKVDGIERQLNPNGDRFPECTEHRVAIADLKEDGAGLQRGAVGAQ